MTSPLSGRARKVIRHYVHVNRFVTYLFTKQHTPVRAIDNRIYNSGVTRFQKDLEPWLEDSRTVNVIQTVCESKQQSF